MKDNTTAGAEMGLPYRMMPNNIWVLCAICIFAVWGPLAVAEETVARDGKAAFLLPTSDCSGAFWTSSMLIEDLDETRNDWARRESTVDSLDQPQSWDQPVRLSLARDDAPLPAPRTDTKDWQFIIAPYIWASAIDGDLTVRGRTISVDASVIDVLEHSDSIIGIEGRMEIWKGRLGGVCGWHLHQNRRR